MDPPKELTYSSVVFERQHFFVPSIGCVEQYQCFDMWCSEYICECQDKRQGQVMRWQGNWAWQGQGGYHCTCTLQFEKSMAWWQEHMAKRLRAAGFQSCKADPDVWLWANGMKIYEYVLCYIDDYIFQGLEPNKFLEHLKKFFTLKEGSVRCLLFILVQMSGCLGWRTAPRHVATHPILGFWLQASDSTLELDKLHASYYES